MKIQSNQTATGYQGAAGGGRQEKKGGFGRALAQAADTALATTATVAPLLPGGAIVSAAANGLRGLTGGTQDASMANQMEQMRQMQRESQIHNLEYMQLQQQMQADNRNFSTVSNLLKVRHDTAKSAINNMQA